MPHRPFDGRRIGLSASSAANWKLYPKMSRQSVLPITHKDRIRCSDSWGFMFSLLSTSGKSKEDDDANRDFSAAVGERLHQRLMATTNRQRVTGWCLPPN